MSPDRAYRFVVAPLAGFFVLGGVVLGVVGSFALLPITSPVPFVHSMAANRAIFTAVGAATVVFGVGFYMKSRAIWLAWFAYVALGTLFICVGWSFDDRFAGSVSWFGVVCGAVMNTVVGVGVYRLTAPVFKRPSVLHPER